MVTQIKLLVVVVEKKFFTRAYEGLQGLARAYEGL